MITFYKLGELGRLGNQLFQYAALRSIGLENSFETGIPNPKFRHWHGQTCLLDRFNIESKFLGDYELGSSIKFSYDEKNHHTYDPEIFSIQDGTDINGFFQSTFYFEKHKIFLYKEDFEKFSDGLKEVIDYIKANAPEILDPEEVLETRPVKESMEEKKPDKIENAEAKDSPVSSDATESSDTTESVNEEEPGEPITENFTNIEFEDLEDTKKS